MGGRRVDELPVGVEPAGIGTGVEDPVVGLDVFLVARGIHLGDESGGGIWSGGTVVEVGDDVCERGWIDVAAVGEETAAGDGGIGFEVVGDQVRRMPLEESGDDPRTAEEIEAGEPIPAEAPFDLLDRRPDRRQQRPLVPEAGDQLLREVVGVFAAVAVSHRPSPASP